MNENTSGSYRSKRSKFKLFTSRLEFENTFQEIKKINVYYYVLGTFLVLCSVYILFFSHYFSIKNIDIIRQDDIVNIDLTYRSVEYARYRPILTEDKEQMKQIILNHQPNIKELYIRKILPDNIKIVIESFPAFFSFERDGRNYLITENGVVIPAKAQKGITKIQLKYKDNLGIIDYKQIFKEEYIDKIKNIVDMIREKNSFIKINEIHYYKKESEVHIVGNNGVIIIFDLTKEPRVQIEKLNVFYKEYLKKIKE